MHKTYLAKKVSHKVNSLSDPAWGLAQVQRIEEYPWKGEANPYSPEKVEFRVLHDGHNLYVRFDTWEEEVRATYTVPNDPVCRDSCVEFFFQPDNADGRYLSFEINPLGTLLIGLGHGIPDIVYLPDDRAQFKIETYKEDHHWQVCYEIPESFMRKFFGNLSTEIRGNFMKCADDSAKPHHGCWSKIDMPHPAFHVPQFFGTLVLEQD